MEINTCTRNVLEMYFPPILKYTGIIFIYYCMNRVSGVTSGVQEIFMSSDIIQHCYLCSDGSVSAIFISPTRVGVDKLRSKFKLKAQGRSVVFNPVSSGERYPECTWVDQVVVLFRWAYKVCIFFINLTNCFTLKSTSFIF